MRGVDFGRRRWEALEGLEDFIPAWAPRRAKRQVRLSAGAWITGLAGQLAFLKESLKPRGGHLTAHDNSLAYVRIPRAASTSLLYAMLTAHYPLLANFSLTAEQINFLADANLEVNMPDRKAAYFTVVRNPFSRLVSVYRQFFERPSASFLYEDYLFGILKKEISFGEFVRTVATIPPALMDQHIRPQYRFLSFYDKNKIDVNILKLEEQDRLRHFLAGHRLQMHGLNRSDQVYDYRDYYDGGLLEVVRKIYSEDFTRLGYSEDLAQADQKLTGQK
jgi:hypothetical protein